MINTGLLLAVEEEINVPNVTVNGVERRQETGEINDDPPGSPKREEHLPR